MMGRSHAISGVLAVTLAGAYLNLDVASLVVLGMVVPGSSLLPDVDHAKSTVSRTYGPVTRGFSKLVGHRQITHSVPGVLALGTVLAGAVAVRDGYPVPLEGVALTAVQVLARVILCAVLILVLAAFLRLFRAVPGRVGSWFRRSWLDDLAPFPFVISVVCFSTINLQLIPVAIMAGCVVHMIGDMITRMGLRIFWPFSKRTYRLAKIKAGGKIEKVVIVPLMCAGIAFSIGVMIWHPVAHFVTLFSEWWG
jgi:membrane-bound metal-dependent hydrolase YbcI (DUF457 family)